MQSNITHSNQIIPLLSDLRFKGYYPELLEKVQSEVQEALQQKKYIEELVEVIQARFNELRFSQNDNMKFKQAGILISDTNERLKKYLQMYSYPIEHTQQLARLVKDQIESLNSVDDPMYESYVQKYIESSGQVTVLTHRVKEITYTLQKEEELLKELQQKFQKYTQDQNQSLHSSLKNKQPQSQKRANSAQRFPMYTNLALSSQIIQSTFQQQYSRSPNHPYEQHESQSSKPKHVLILFEQSGREQIKKLREHLEKKLKRWLADIKPDKITLITFCDKIHSQDIRSPTLFCLPKLEKKGIILRSYYTSQPKIQELFQEVLVKIDRKYENQALLIVEGFDEQAIKFNFDKTLKLYILGIGYQKMISFSHLAQAINGTDRDPVTGKDYFEACEDANGCQTALQRFANDMFSTPMTTNNKPRDTNLSSTLPTKLNQKLTQAREQIQEKSRALKTEMLQEAQQKYQESQNNYLMSLTHEETQKSQQISNLKEELVALQAQLTEMEWLMRQNKEQVFKLNDQKKSIVPSAVSVERPLLESLLSMLLQFEQETLNYKVLYQEFTNDIGTIPFEFEHENNCSQWHIQLLSMINQLREKYKI